MSSTDWISLAGLGLLALFAAGGALMLRAARCPGWPLIGGVLAGIVLGPGIMGRLVPNAYEHIFVGGVEQRQALQALHGRQGADLLATETMGASADAAAALLARHREEREAAEAVLAEARWIDQRGLRRAALAIVALTLLGSAASTVRAGRVGASLAAPLSIGAWAAALPGAAVYFALTTLGTVDAAPALLAASAAAIGPWALTRFDRDAADGAEVGGAAMVQTAGRVASVIAIGAAGWALWRSAGLAGLGWACALLGLPLSWLVPVAHFRGVRAVVELGLVPLLGALAAVRIDVLEHFAFWPVMLFLLISGDGRWLGAFTGAMIPGGRRPLRTMRLVLGSMAAGPTQVAVTAIAVHTMALPEALPLAMLVGAMVIEAAAPARRAASDRLVSTEEEIEELRR